MPCVSPLRGFVDKLNGGITFKRSDSAGADMRVQCGQCLGCRIDRRKIWGARICHEASQYKTNSFLTLTYRDRSACTKNQLEKGLYIPESGTLVKSHHQKFMKRLRKHFQPRRLRYYQAGEYGDDDNRPHYHSCLFNLAFDDEQFYCNNYGNPLFTSQTLEELWGYGFCTVGDVTYQSAQYVAGYVLKKITGKQAHDHYLRNDENGNPYWLEPEYSTMSTGTKKGNGIGADWFKTYHTDVFPSDNLPVPGVGVVRGVPRYYEEIYKDINPDSLEEVKKLRRKFAEAHPELYTQQHYKSQYLIYQANKKERPL